MEARFANLETSDTKTFNVLTNSELEKHIVHLKKVFKPSHEPNKISTKHFVIIVPMLSHIITNQNLLMYELKILPPPLTAHTSELK